MAKDMTKHVKALLMDLAENYGHEQYCLTQSALHVAIEAIIGVPYAMAEKERSADGQFEYARNPKTGAKARWKMIVTGTRGYSAAFRKQILAEFRNA